MLFVHFLLFSLEFFSFDGGLMLLADEFEGRRTEAVLLSVLDA